MQVTHSRGVQDRQRGRCDATMDADHAKQPSRWPRADIESQNLGSHNSVAASCPTRPLSSANRQQALRFGVSVIMAEKSCTIRTRKFMTNKLLMRRQFVSLRAAICACHSPSPLRSPPSLHAMRLSAVSC